MTGGLKIEGDSERVGHILIARPDKREAAQARLERMGIDAITLPAITPTRLSEGMAQVGYARFGGGTIPRTPASHGAGLSHIAALSMGRALQKEWVFIWEEDVEGVADLGRLEIMLPINCGVVYLGGILWGDARHYGDAGANGGCKGQAGIIRGCRQW